MELESAAIIKVLIVDDDPLAVSTLKNYFSRTDDIQVVAEAFDGGTALNLLRLIQVDLVLADIHMPLMDGLALLQEIRKMPDPPSFIAITALDHDSTMLEILRHGGMGYIIKSSKPVEIITAVRSAMANGTTISPQPLTRLLQYLPGEHQVPKSEEISHYNKLTKREKVVLAHICDGKSNLEIARKMGYSEATVKKHVSYLIQHFQASSRLSLAVKTVGLKHIWKNST